MNKKIVLIVSLLALVLVIFLTSKYLPKKSPATDLTNTETQTLDEEVVASSTKPASTNQSATQTTKEIAWNLFQKYLSYNKDLNLSGVKSTVYKVAEICNTVEPTQDCKDRMNSAYSYGSAFEKNKFTNVWSDEKQIILSTDFWTEEIKELKQYGRFRSIIFFIKDKDGAWKMLSFSPFQGKTIDGNGLSSEEVSEKAILYTKDEDKDGVADYDEECSNQPEGSKCIKTNSELRDTDLDGLWDGTDLLVK